MMSTHPPHPTVKKRAPEWLVSVIAWGLVVLVVTAVAGIAYLFRGPAGAIWQAWHMVIYAALALVVVVRVFRK